MARPASIATRETHCFVPHRLNPRASAEQTATDPMPIGTALSRSRGSALECGSIQEGQAACNVPAASENVKGKTMLIRIVLMLAELGQGGHKLRENLGF